MIEMVIRNWRITRGIPSGSHMWFDPSCEYVKLFRIPHLDGEAVPGGLPEVDEAGGSGYLDKVGSVSADGPGQATGDSDRFRQVRLFKEESDLPF